jgi:hypothetical protein
MDTLSDSEEKFLYHVEILGFTPARAAGLCGIDSPQNVLAKPRAVEMRAQLKDSLRKKTEITKEDVINGFMHAIQQADLLGEPMTQIAGWERISKMLGYDKPVEVIIWNADAKGIRRQIAQVSDAELVKMLEADNIVDGEFYVKPDP